MICTLSQNLHMRDTAQCLMEENDEGFWFFDDDFAKLFGMKLDMIKAKIPPVLSAITQPYAPEVSESLGQLLWSTVLALELLEMNFKDEKEKWEASGKKAERWLTHRVEEFKLSEDSEKFLQQLRQLAAQFLKKR